jgi:hypothetical protein
MKGIWVVIPALLALSPSCSTSVSSPAGRSGGNSGSGSDGSTGDGVGAGSNADSGVTEASPARSACDPSFLMAEGLTGSDLVVEAKYVNQPPLSQDPEGDHLAVPKDRATFLRSASYAFSGELLDAPEGLGPGDTWDMNQAYQVRVDTEYWNLGSAPLPALFKTTVIGWIPPKRGRLFFWGMGSLQSPTELQSYVAAQPRTAWFCPTAGLYDFELTGMTQGSTACKCAPDSCVTTYHLTGRVSETRMGRIATGQTLNFPLENPPAGVSPGATYLFSGVPGAEWGLTLVDDMGASQSAAGDACGTL